ncbi:GTPase domain-containing protein [Oxyplasma meridianum]|uniref:GTPase domain-containing protein n=1 Tax=Oxyplasma meridianum TaxID=3073602 RepID=A0AAX4NHM9_9ARCH
MDTDRLTWKVSIVGPTGSGKSSLISRIVYDSDNPASTQKMILRKRITVPYNGGTRSVDFLFQELEETDKTEKFLTGSTAILITADVTSKDSLKYSEEILKFISGFERKPLVVVLGTKTDLRYEAVIWQDELDRLAKKYGALSFLVTAKNANDVPKVLEQISSRLLEKVASKRK